jgi:hypothetical protein
MNLLDPGTLIALGGLLATTAGSFAVTRNQVAELSKRADEAADRVDALKADLTLKIETLQRETVSKEVLSLHMQNIDHRMGQMLEMQKEVSRRLDTLINQPHTKGQ